MKTLKTLIIAAVSLAAAAGIASAQDYMDWSSISPYGLEMQDQYGDIHYVDPYAYDSQVDIYGNVYSSYGYEMQPGIGMYDLTPAWQDNSFSTGTSSSTYFDTNPYAGATDSHSKFLESIWE